MGYGKEIYEEAKNELERRRQSADRAAQERLEEFYARCPRAQAVKEAIGSLSAKTAMAVLGGKDAREELEGLRNRVAELNKEYDKLLAEHGLARRDVAPRRVCDKCGDTGFVDGKMCSCMKQLQKAIAYQKLSMDVPLEKSTFETFSLEHYRGDERAYRQMEAVYRTCRDYARNLRADSPSFLFKGGTGLGKTHLSLAIAGAAIEKGMGVIYGSAQSFASALEKERFDREGGDGADTTYSQLTTCDLLILDDLGTEVSSSFVKAALYDVINTRMQGSRPTIISTNLSMSELEKNYSQRFASRIAGYYGKLEFLGRDVRVQKLQSRAAGRK